MAGNSGLVDLSIRCIHADWQAMCLYHMHRKALACSMGSKSLSEAHDACLPTNLLWAHSAGAEGPQRGMHGLHAWASSTGAGGQVLQQAQHKRK